MDAEENRTQELAQKRREFVADYPCLWEKMLSEWSSDTSKDLLWLMYSASYLFVTSGVRWAVDPIRASTRLAELPECNIQLLENLSFVLLTHDHGDHFDPELISRLKEAQITWVVPDFMTEKVKTCEVPADQMIVLDMMNTIELMDIKITPFPGLHGEKGRGEKQCTGYLVEHKGQRLLFPGDVRTMNPDLVPPFGPVDILFAHLWLGRGEALLSVPSKLSTFCNFIISLDPKQVMLTHLYELKRDKEDCWCISHAEMVKKFLKRIDQKIEVQFPPIGKPVAL